MATLLRNIITTYNYLHYDLSDPRTQQYYIILNPFIMVSFAIIFYKFVYNWGPKYMEHREPFKLENILIIYNIFQILTSAYICSKSIALVWWTGYYNFMCQPLNWEDTPIERDINSLVRLYYLVKILDLMDTVFFVLRKKHKQVSFLHVYHHLSMLLLGFVGLKYVPAGHGSMIGIVNSAVHTIMYFYYLLACINPDYKKSIWWKKYITQLQIGQFLFLLIHFGRIVFQPACTYPKWISLAFVPQNLFMLVMFTDFYIRTYIKKKNGLKKLQNHIKLIK